MEFTFYDYKLFCSLMDLKPSHYDSLKEFKNFVKLFDK